MSKLQSLQEHKVKAEENLRIATRAVEIEKSNLLSKAGEEEAELWAGKLENAQTKEEAYMEGGKHMLVTILKKMTLHCADYSDGQFTWFNIPEIDNFCKTVLGEELYSKYRPSRKPYRDRVLYEIEERARKESAK